MTDRMLFGIDKDVRKLVRVAEAHGAEVDMNGAGHLRWRFPSGRTYHCAGTGSRTTLLRARTILAKEGIPL